MDQQPRSQLQPPSQEESQRIQSLVMTLRIVSIALILSSLMFVMISYQRVVPQKELSNLFEIFQNPATMVFGIWALMMFVVSFILPNFLFRNSLKRDTNLSVLKVLQIYFVSHIIGYALLESMSIMGFVTAIGVHQPRAALIFAAPAIAAMAIRFPSLDSILQKAENILGRKIA